MGYILSKYDCMLFTSMLFTYPWGTVAINLIIKHRSSFYHKEIKFIFIKLTITLQFVIQFGKAKYYQRLSITMCIDRLVLLD